MKHNKKRNTAFLYEALIRELTKCALNKNIEKAKLIKSIIVEYFNSNTELYKEIQIYKLLQDSTIEEDIADKYLNEVKNRYEKIDKKNIFNQQTALINTINKKLGQEIYNNFIPAYKDLATISQILNSSVSIKEKIYLENKLLEKISLKEATQKSLMDQVDKIVFKQFNKKFNEKYSNSLLKEQKELLNYYVNSYENTGIDFKIYLNEEIERLKGELNICLDKDEISSQEDIKSATKKTILFLNNVKDVKELSQDMLQKILKIQQYVHEVNN